MDDQLSERGVEGPAGEGQILPGRLLHVDAGISQTRRGDERRRRVHGRDGHGAQPRNELGGERTGPATDVEHALSRTYPCEIRQLGGELARISAHEAVVGIGCQVKAHDANVPGASAVERRDPGLTTILPAVLFR